MEYFARILNSTLKQIYSSIHQNFYKEKVIQQDQTLKSDFPLQIKNPNSNDKVCSSTKNWKNEYGLIPEKMKSFNLLFFLLSFCNPISCPEVTRAYSCNQNKPLVFQIPCEVKYVTPKKKEKPKPVGLITRNKELELHGGEIIYGCTCGRRNGLDGDAECRRSCCQNNPGCLMRPPQCWPQFKEPPKPPKPKMIYIPVDVVYYHPPESH